MRQLNNQEQQSIAGALSGWHFLGCAASFGLCGLGYDALFNVDSQKPFIGTGVGITLGALVPLVTYAGF